MPFTPHTEPSLPADTHARPPSSCAHAPREATICHVSGCGAGIIGGIIGIMPPIGMPPPIGIIICCGCACCCCCCHCCCGCCCCHCCCGCGCCGCCCCHICGAAAAPA